MHTQDEASRQIRQMDRLVRETLNEFSDHLDKQQFSGKEHDLVNRYAHGFLMARCSPRSFLKHPTQIGIEVGVAQPKGSGFLRPAARKDLVIWPKPWMSCWNASWEAENHPIAVLEWKVRVKATELRCDRHDENWLTAFSKWQPDFVGYAVTLSRTRPAAQKMSVSRFHRGGVDRNWLKVP